MADHLPGERRNVALLAANQALYLIAAITVMTLSGVVGQQLAQTPALATLPVAMMQVGALVSTFPASMLMRRIGRRAGFLIGSIGGGMLGAAVATVGIIADSFALFCLGNLLLGVYQAFAMYYRFAAADCAGESFRSIAISLVMAGGVIAAFLGPWNASFSQSLMTNQPLAGPYVMLTGLALVAGILLTLLRVPPSREPEPDAPAQRTLPQIMMQPAFLVALTAATVGYAMMIMIMTATPIAMQHSGFSMLQIATVMQWHVLGMFAPSFVTGWLISRYGVLNILLAGGLLLVGALGTALSGESFSHYLMALLLLGVAWNFLFVGGTTLLTETHTVEERGKVQGINDLIIFSMVALSSLLAGVLLHQIAWQGLNLSALPFALLTLAVTSALALQRRRVAAS